MNRAISSVVLASLLGCGDAGGGDPTASASEGPTASTGPAGTSTAATDDAGSGTEPTSDPTGGRTSTDGDTSTGSDTSTSGDPTTGETGETGGTTAELASRPNVLIYRGNDGKDTYGDYFRFEQLGERLAAADKTVTDTEQWPDSFDDVGLVLLVVNAEPFSDAQLADLAGVLAGGGVVVVMNEWEYYAESENLGAVLAGLGSSLSFMDALAADAAGGTVTVDWVSDHPLMAGVASMLLAAGSAVLGCDGGRELVSVDGVCVMAAEEIGPGLVLAFGDTDTLSDHVLIPAAEDQNFALVANLVAALP